MDNACFILTGYENKGICRWCGGPFPDKRHTAYCCPEHQRQYDRHFEWGCASRWALERYHFCCGDCGAKNELEVHHIIPLNGGERFYSILNCPCNLIPLCRHTCHPRWGVVSRMVERSEIIRSKQYGIQLELKCD